MDITDKHGDIKYTTTFPTGQERAASLEYCPWCSSKGLTYALRSYRINLEESVTLCTNQQCLFPLVSQPLEDVLSSLQPAEPSVRNKRKGSLALEKEETVKPAHKRLRTDELTEEQHNPEAPILQKESCSVNTVSNGQCTAPEKDDELANEYHEDTLAAETTGCELQQDEAEGQHNTLYAAGFSPSTSLSPAQHPQCSSDVLLTAEGAAPTLSPHRVTPSVSEAEDEFMQVKSPPEAPNSLDSHQSLFPKEDSDSIEINTPLLQRHEQTALAQQKSQTADIPACKETEELSYCNFIPTTTNMDSEEFEPLPDHIFWKNSSSLCWLDSMLIALVKCKSLSRCKPKDEPQRSAVWQLMGGYEDICAAIQLHKQTTRDGVVTVPHHVLQKANEDLQSLRMSVFERLQPKLHCKLGRKETPVFAMPLLLAMDSWADPLFQSTFYWEFKCSECKAATTERFIKTLPTFTNILPDWRPLHAVHSAPCNVCRKKKQRRTMLLESLPPVFQLHFVEGLPDNDVDVYAFTFKGKHYSVTTVIQYNHQLKHFVTWIRNSDGSWLEYDDLKHPDCESHEKLPVPPKEMHVVFWEGVEEEKEPRACSPSSTFAESPQFKTETNSGLTDKDENESLLMSHGDTDIISALSAMDTTVAAGVDTSIGSTTLIDTFEGLTHNDIITLTMVELNPGAEMMPSNDSGQTQDSLCVPSMTETLNLTPDSSSAVIGDGTSHRADVEPPIDLNSSEAEGSSSSDSAIVPSTRGRRGRGRGRGRGGARGIGRGRDAGRQCTKAVSPKAAPRISSPTSLEPSNPIPNDPECLPAQKKTLPVTESSPVSSTNTEKTSVNHKTPTTLDQNARWSFLLSKHPLSQLPRSTPKPAPAPVKKVAAAPHSHSTPNPVRRQQIPGGGFPKLKTDERDGLPLKAAEMYGAFGAKSSSTMPSPALPQSHPKPFKPVTSHHKTNTTAVPDTSLPAEISSSKKKHKSSKVPPGLSETEVLRYKLLKKLKAKKKLLAKLDKRLGHQGGANIHPDSTDLGSPITVTSSTYDGSICDDDFLSDLLSPATTASNLSPDSTGFLEMLANGQDGAAIGKASQVNVCMNTPDTENFLEDLFKQPVAQRPSDMEMEALSALEYFI